MNQLEYQRQVIRDEYLNLSSVEEKITLKILKRKPKTKMKKLIESKLLTIQE